VLNDNYVLNEYVKSEAYLMQASSESIRIKQAMLYTHRPTDGVLTGAI